jgi:hypothetical protein
MLASTALKAALLIRVPVGWVFFGWHSIPEESADPTSCDSVSDRHLGLNYHHELPILRLTGRRAAAAGSLPIDSHDSWIGLNEYQRVNFAGAT